MLEIEPVSFGPWSGAWRLVRGEMEMIVVGEIGPRIMSLRHAGGPNLLFVDEGQRISRGDWVFYGGSRFWVSPETETSYFPENSASEATRHGETLTLTGPAEPSGLRRSITIAAARRHAGFEITYRLDNVGEMTARGGVWVLTCALGPGRLICPWDEGTQAWATQMIRFWRTWSTFGTDVASPQWYLGNGLLVVEPTGETGKVGVYSKNGLLALVRDDGTFIKQADPVPGMVYPDGGCNLEICTTPNFIEMETLGPLVDLLPGEGVSHVEQWLFTPNRYQPEQWPALLELVTGTDPGREE